MYNFINCISYYDMSIHLIRLTNISIFTFHIVAKITSHIMTIFMTLFINIKL